MGGWLVLIEQQNNNIANFYFDMATQHSPPGSKKKEIYKYLAPWTVYGMNWSVRQDKRFRIAVGSFIEDYSNKVGCLEKSVVSYIVGRVCLEGGAKA